MKASDDKDSDNHLESIRTEVSLLSVSATFTLLPSTEEGELLRRQKYALLTQWEETRCEG